MRTSPAAHQRCSLRPSILEQSEQPGCGSTNIALGFEAGLSLTSGSNNFDIRTGVLADLKITNTDGKTSITNSTSDTYTITVTNTGLPGVTGLGVTDNFPVQFTNVTFTATQKGGATGFTASGTGNISNSVNMPPGSSITYKAMGMISGTSGAMFTNIASLTIPAGVHDPNSKDNTASDTDTIL
jgi:uncharacterized repeat protein (TIGR01451 family)